VSCPGILPSLADPLQQDSARGIRVYKYRHSTSTVPRDPPLTARSFLRGRCSNRIGRLLDAFTERVRKHQCVKYVKKLVSEFSRPSLHSHPKNIDLASPPQRPDVVRVPKVSYRVRRGFHSAYSGLRSMSEYAHRDHSKRNPRSFHGGHRVPCWLW
jgi:hypothetical protein